MNITILTTDSVPMLGGIADYLHNMCIELSKTIPISVHSTVPPTAESDTDLPYPMHRIPETRKLGERFGDNFPLTRKLNTLAWYLNRPYEARALVRNIQKENKPKHIFIGRWEERSHFWCRACHSIGIPYYLFAYGMDLTEIKSPRWHKKRHQDFLNAHRIISISGATTETVLNLGVDKTKVLLVPPGIRPERFQKISSEKLNQVLSRSGLFQKGYILSLCRLVKRKGIDLTIRAFAEIAKDFPDILLVIAGDGPESSNLEPLAKHLGLLERVRFLGDVDDLTKRALFQGCEFFVMPNRSIPGDMEGFGIVFLEAGLFGKAVIGGNNGGVPDAVLHGETGLLVDTSDSHKPLADAMLRLLREPMLAQKLGNAGKKRAVRKFSWKHLASDLINAITLLKY